MTVTYWREVPGNTPLTSVPALIGSVAYINADTTYHVKTTGNDSTGDGSSGTPWLTLAKALDYLKLFWISPTAMVTIQLGVGAFAVSSHQEINHPCGDRIVIQGTSESYAFAATVAVNGSSVGAGNWLQDFTFTGGNATTITANLLAGDYVLLRNLSGGTFPTRLAGVHDVITRGSGTMQIRTRHRAATVASGSVVGNIVVLRTRITTTSDGLVLTGRNQLGVLQDLAIVGDASAGYIGLCITGRYQSSVYAGVGGSINKISNVGVCNFGLANLEVGQGGQAYAVNSAFSGAVAGATAGHDVIINGGVLNGSGVVISGGAEGLAVTGGYARFEDLLVTGATSSGIGVRNGGRVELGATCVLDANQGDNLWAASQGSIVCQPGVISRYSNSYGVYASKRAFILALGLVYTGNVSGDTYPTPNTSNTAGNDEGYIDT